MKKTILTLSIILLGFSLSGQDLATIVKKNFDATGGKKRASAKSIVMEGNLSQMGMSMTVKIYEKKPDKMKLETTFNGMNIVQMVNGDRGMMINPMAGSSDPVALTGEQIEQIRANSVLNNNMNDQLAAGKLELMGTSTFAGEPAFEIKTSTEMGDAFIYISTKSFLTLGTKMTTSQMGQNLNVELRMKDYKDFNGVKIAMTTDTYINGNLSGTMTYTNIKFDEPIPDSVFEIK